MVQSSMLPERLHTRVTTAGWRRMRIVSTIGLLFAVHSSFDAFCTMEDKLTNHGFGILSRKVALRDVEATRKCWVAMSRCMAHRFRALGRNMLLPWALMLQCTASDQSLLWEEITSVKNQLTNDANGLERSSLLGVTRIDVDLQWRIQEILWMVVSTDIWRYLIWDFCLIATASTSLGLLWPSIFYGPVLPLSQESCNLNMYKLRLDSDLLRRLWLSPEIRSYLPWTPFWIIDYFLSFKRLN